MSTKTMIRATLRRILRPTDSAIVEGLSTFQNSSGSLSQRSQNAMRAANLIFPVLVDLLSLTDVLVKEPLSVESWANDDRAQQAAAQLGSAFESHGSDKATVHDYHLLYGSILAKPESITHVLEVGIGTNNLDVVSNMGAQGKPGASLRAFRDFLPNAQIYGADIDIRILFTEDRIHTFFVDQTDRRSFEQLGAQLNSIEFDLIIDDGLHSPDANIQTLIFGLGRLKAGGWLVVEDISRRSLPIWQAVSALLPEQYEPHIVAAKAGILFAVRRSAANSGAVKNTERPTPRMKIFGG